jgi:subtilisin family serine protease
VSKAKLNIFVSASFDKNLLQSLNLKATDFYPTTLQAGEEWATISLPTAITDMEYLQLTNRLKNTAGITGVAKHYQNGNQTTGTSNVFYVKLKAEADFAKLQQLATQTNTTIHHQLAYQPLWYALCRKPNTLMDSVQLTNYFYETNQFSMVDPAFVFEIRIPEPTDEPCIIGENYAPPTCITNDNILNWGQYNHGNPNFDINMCEAWGLSQGQNTKTAVMDTGIQLNHPDMAANISPFSYNTATNSSPSVVYDAHGSFVAGIIGAVKDNNIGLAGVAPQTQLISISSSLTAPNMLFFLENQANGIGFAKRNRADVVNNSWGVISSSLYSTLLT